MRAKILLLLKLSISSAITFFQINVFNLMNMVLLHNVCNRSLEGSAVNLALLAKYKLFYNPG